MNALIQFVQIAVVARLLGPEEYGLAALAFVVVGFAQVFTDVGLSNALIYRQTASRSVLSTLYWVNCLGGLTVFLIVVSLAGTITSSLGEPEAGGLLSAAALLFLIVPLGQQFQVLLQRDLRFRFLAVAEMAAAATGAVVAVTTAFSGAGAFAVVYGSLANGVVRTVFFVASGWRQSGPSLHFRLEDLRGYLSFGMYQLGERTIGYFNSRVDQLAIAILMPASALAFYNLAYNLVIFPVMRINPIVTRVAFPLFARVQDDPDRLGRGFLLALRLLSWINFPVLLGLAAVAADAVPIVFGDRWEPAVPIVQILAVVGLLRTIGNPIGSVLLAKGRADLGFNWNLSLLLVQPLAVGVGAISGGLVGVALAVAGVQIAYAALAYFVLVRPLVAITARMYVASFSRSFTSALAMAVVVAVVGLAVPTSLAWLLLQVAIAAVVYLLISAILLKDELRAARLLRSPLAGGPTR